jgi:hypothetical protein
MPTPSLLPTDQHATFILAGNATFTIVNTATGGRFTFRVRQCEDRPELYFVQVLTGPENTRDYTYLGTIRDGKYEHGRKSSIGPDAPSARAFNWFWGHLNRLPEQVEVWHVGRCGRCGRALTVPESIQLGLGPECKEKM